MILLLLPVFIFYALFTLWPLAEVAFLSLHKTNFITTTFVGFGNFVSSFSDTAFILSICNSAFYIVFMVPLQLIISLVIALLAFDLNKRWQDASRIILYIPTLSAGIIIAQLWKWIFSSGGFANWIFELLSLPLVNWFGSTVTAIPTVSLIIVFSSFGANVIIFLASMLSIDKSIFEAAIIDGASSIQIKIRIICPMIKKTIWLIILLTSIAALQIFETIYSLAPYEHSATMTFHIYRQGFQFSKYGMASAQSIILLLFTVAISLVKNKVVKDD